MALNGGLDAIYTELIMENSRNPANRRELPQSRGLCTERGHNPSCGDDITLQIDIESGRIKDMAFSGFGCAISQASTNIMIDLLRGKTVGEAKTLCETFINMIKRESVDEDALIELEDACAFKNISNMPARVKCATLAWHTLSKALNEKYGL
ncbi:MAG: SUF system NifU family Fe-S cluster assembly protein [Oscillospiraceae bacterium]|jgi:nitrogen fixation NifU-like protein|nr:SUF system NifU family Fe-S cluster assembly protein [Oscillospiraceae bacterium]